LRENCRADLDLPQSLSTVFAYAGTPRRDDAPHSCLTPSSSELAWIRALMLPARLLTPGILILIDCLAAAADPLI